MRGALLIAHPSLLEPNFRRTVLYVAEYSPEEGALALILNRPTGKIVGDVVEEGGLGALGRAPVFFGGPVGRDRLTFAALRWRAEAQALECAVNLDLEEAREVATEPDAVVRGFVGYAGWSAGQLEGELEQKAWVVQKPDRDLLDTEACTQAWFTIMRQYGPWFRLLAAAPDDPSLN